MILIQVLFCLMTRKCRISHLCKCCFVNVRTSDEAYPNDRNCTTSASLEINVALFNVFCVCYLTEYSFWHHIHCCSSVEFDSYIFAIHFHHQRCFLFLGIITFCHTISLVPFVDCCSAIIQFLFILLH